MEKCIISTNLKQWLSGIKKPVKLHRDGHCHQNEPMQMERNDDRTWRAYGEPPPGRHHPHINSD